MCTGITVAKRYVPMKVDSKIEHMLSYGNIVSITKKSGDFPKNCFFKDRLAKYNINAG